MAQITARFRQTRQTPGAVLYNEVDKSGIAYRSPSEPGCVIGTLYIRKTAFQAAAVKIPNDFTVTIDIKE